VVAVGVVGAFALAPVTAHAGPASSGTYVIKAGDSLYRIALDEHVSLDALLQANGLKLDSLILPGQTLVLPGAAQPAAQGTTSPAAQSNVQIAVSPSIYVVQPGDGLYQIAQKLGVSLNDLLTVNGLKVTSLIVPGQPLKVPANGRTLSITTPSAAQQPAKRGSASATSSGSQANVQAPSAKAAAVVAFARAQLGKPYLFAAAGPDAYDCSGLVVAAYNSIGVKLPHHAATQSTYGVAVDWKTSPILPGDLVFTHSTSGGDLSHVGIALDATHYIHAPRTGDVVKIAPMPASSVIQAVRRIITS
jgi:cell wall-associated NlpC family hydrolase